MLHLGLLLDGSGGDRTHRRPACVRPCYTRLVCDHCTRPGWHIGRNTAGSPRHIVFFLIDECVLLLLLLLMLLLLLLMLLMLLLACCLFLMRHCYCFRVLLQLWLRVVGSGWCCCARVVVAAVVGATASEACPLKRRHGFVVCVGDGDLLVCPP